jgi:hypothetical protein
MVSHLKEMKEKSIENQVNIYPKKESTTSWVYHIFCSQGLLYQL